MRKRQARAERIVRLLAATDSTHASEFGKTAYGWIAITSQTMEVSKATASRDCALVRRLYRQFLRMFGRDFDAKRDRVVWTWNWAHYGFATRESEWAGHKKCVGHFPFDTRRKETEESYCGFDQSSWQNINSFSNMNSWALMRTYGRVLKMRDRLRNRLRNRDPRYSLSCNSDHTLPSLD